MSESSIGRGRSIPGELFKQAKHTFFIMFSGFMHTKSSRKESYDSPNKGNETILLTEYRKESLNYYLRLSIILHRLSHFLGL